MSNRPAIDSTRYFETYDYITPNTTCDATTMTCPIPHTWAHIDYTSTDQYGVLDVTTPEPAEGSCVQNKFGSGNVGTCTDVLGQETQLWTANCGDAVSYFWFERTACGALREYHTEVGMITDKWTATPVATMVDALVAGIYGTPAAPEYEPSFGGGITWNTVGIFTCLLRILPRFLPQVTPACPSACLV